MRIETGPRKTPDGYYLIVVEGSDHELGVVEQLAAEAGAEVERAGNVLFIKVKSRSLRDKLYRRMKRSFAEARSQ